MDREFSGYKRRDFVIAVIITLITFLVCGMQLTYGMPQLGGDDFAAYISEGIAISDGTLKEQAAKNYIQHPSPMPDEATEKELVYVWGFPLLLSLVHRLIGFDLTTYSTFFFYKIPSLIAFALMEGCLYLYYRRYFSAAFASFLALLFSTSIEVVSSINLLAVDIVFLLFSVLTFLISECFLASLSDTAHKRRKYLLSVFLGFSFWCTYETRLNGNTVILIVAVSHIFHLFRQKEKEEVYKLQNYLLPYLTFYMLKIASEWILMPATSNFSDVGDTTLEMIWFNLGYYARLVGCWWMSFFAYPEHPFWIIFFVLTVIGFAWKAFTVKNLHLTLLILGTYLVLVLLPYTQGMRYLFNILPILLLFTGYGAMFIFLKVSRKFHINRVIGKTFFAFWLL